MKNKSTRLCSLALALVLSLSPMGTVSTWAQGETSGEMTLLDISRGPISIDTDHISGYSEDGALITQTNPNGYHVVSRWLSRTDNKITVEAGVHTTLVADNLSIHITDTDSEHPSPLFVRPGASLTLILEGENEFWGAAYNAAIGVPQAADGTMAELVIQGTGSALCRTGKRGAGIGGGQRCGYTDGAGVITINSGTIQATGGDYGGGIGNAEYTGPRPCQITINGGDVTAVSSSQSSGIGGGRPKWGAAAADITINGGVIHAQSPDTAIRGSSLQMGGGNVVAISSSGVGNWQSLSPAPTGAGGGSVRLASVQLDPLDAGKELRITCGGRSYTARSDQSGRVNAILFDGEGSEVEIASPSGNTYSVDLTALISPSEIVQTPYQYPLLTVTPDAGQRFSYGDEIVPSFTVYQADGTPLDQGGSLFSGNLSCERPLSYPPVSVSITAGDLRLVSPSHCFTVAQGETLQIDRRRIQVTASDLQVYEGQYNCYNYPFSFQLTGGSLAPGDKLETAFSARAALYDGQSAYPQGTHPNIPLSFSSGWYDVSLAGAGPTLTVLKNECLFVPGDTLSFGADADGNSLRWTVAGVDDGAAYLCSERVYEDLPFAQAQDCRRRVYQYIADQFPSLYDPSFIFQWDILSSEIATVLFPAGLPQAKATDAQGNPARYWMFCEGTPPYADLACYVDESGALQTAASDQQTAGVRLFLAIDLTTHTVPLLSPAAGLTPSTTYGDIAAGTPVAQVTDGAVMGDHQTKAYTLSDRSTQAERFTLQSDGSIVANERLPAGSYTLYVEAEDEGTGYRSEGRLTFTVNPKPLTITPAPDIAIPAGQPLPTIPYTCEAGGLLPGDALTGQLAVSGELTPGAHPIALGTLSAGPNYRLVLAGEAQLTVLAPPEESPEEETPPEPPPGPTPEPLPPATGSPAEAGLWAPVALLAVAVGVSVKTRRKTR